MKFFKNLICKIGIHWYQFKFQEGANSYYECKLCGLRTHAPTHSSYSPLNKKWLEYNDDTK